MPEIDYVLAQALHDLATKLHPYEKAARHHGSPEDHKFWFDLIDQIYKAEKKVLDGPPR